MHRLTDELPESAGPEAAKLLEELGDERAGLLLSLRDTSWDDEPLTEAELKGLERVCEDVLAGRPAFHEEACHRLLGRE